MCVRGKEHKNPSLNDLSQLREQQAQVTEASFHVLVLKIEFEFAAAEAFYHGGEDLRIVQKMLINQLNSELSSKFLVENLHRLQSATRKDHAEWLLLCIFYDLSEYVARIEAIDAPLSHVLLVLFVFDDFICADEKFKVEQLRAVFVTVTDQVLDLSYFIQHLNNLAKFRPVHRNRPVRLGNICGVFT